MTAEREAPLAETDKENRLDLRTEYAALTSTFNLYLTFRFTLLGLFLTATGLILRVQANPTVDLYLLQLALTISVFLVELRTRTLYQSLRARGAQIEYVYWGQSRGIPLEGLYGRQLSNLPMKQPPSWLDEVKLQPDRYPPFFIGTLRLPSKVLTHSFGLDVIYSIVFLYCLWGIAHVNHWVGL